MIVPNTSFNASDLDGGSWLKRSAQNISQKIAQNNFPSYICHFANYLAYNFARYLAYPLYISVVNLLLIRGALRWG
jgi:hypothetical protein